MWTVSTESVFKEYWVLCARDGEEACVAQLVSDEDIQPVPPARRLGAIRQSAAVSKA